MVRFEDLLNEACRLSLSQCRICGAILERWDKNLHELWHAHIEEVLGGEES